MLILDEASFHRDYVTFLSFFSVGPCTSVMLNCTQPDSLSLLKAIQPVFDLNPIRPVTNVSSPTSVSIGFTLYGILGVVRDIALT